MLNMKWTLSAVMLAASLASAQMPSYRGKFTLPFEARFGNVVLQPGSYTVATLDGAKGIRITGENGHVSLLAAGTDVKPTTERARMVLVDKNGMYALQSFESGSMGVELQFLVTKHPERIAATARPNVEVGLQ